MRLKEKGAIAGVGYTPQGRVSGRPSLSFCFETASNAFKDAGLQREDAVKHLMDKLPYVIAIVELDESESPHLTSNIIGSAHDPLECDLVVMVTWEDVTG